MGFSLEIITPRGIYFNEKVDSLTIKMTTGYRTFLTGHMPLIGSLDYAPMHLIKDGKLENFAVHGGAINVTKEKICVICGAIENARDIDESRALAAKERAEKRLREKDPDTDLKRAQLALQRSLIRLEVLSKK